ncbi:phosphatidylserine decarboxylase [Clostridium novyi]|uniref:Phosphatidylserine decarboxylase proenzyme n=1 Tax=Clostridium novyi (strain NT) TaxID=386415 RepID=PSD_CLONN|nr:phosphatidylserine decarboxylase [Clostridium novyi]A0Q3R9.1 RecName: Full=Phosphatidylserine decarboxylase proenzyme; Contains: RecName: Full=Phosphatidylserine decarboxylase alpha chain; Contains: RecName: Full=Phosphatidylserine decarboxylase beta chain [Clostridium novyi NT]ABK62661.1 Phosphatidylserine decarboxylase proenzyme 1 [Clostridium novyi NT]KEH85283.1 phosphatidylserine decarboxylase [Clostridium novyi A str. NCTC 538]
MIKVFNRKEKIYDIEKVAGDNYLKWIYSSPVGLNFLELMIKKKFFSKLYGKYCDSKHSAKKVSKFIDDFNINEKEFTLKKSDFKSFNDFFYRKLNNDARPIINDENILISPADGRLFAYENIDIHNLIQVKGLTYSLDELLKNIELAEKYIGGTCLLFRLAPVDYHRFHFIDDGICEEAVKISGSYYSVNPIALEKVPKLFCENKREYSIFHSKHFGDVLYVDVGATCVGSIIQTYTPNEYVVKGDEKGYFKFGGSTIILFFEKDKIIVDKDIVEQTQKGFECKVLMGEKIGTKL